MLEQQIKILEPRLKTVRKRLEELSVKGGSVSRSTDIAERVLVAAIALPS
ncbi:MAG: DUF5320 domain-containing protein [Candidatus Brockarchaeota archaeon]|nr:DUF5320 domain-containing protein [Candidatus Brockarchaeota archaeon]